MDTQVVPQFTTPADLFRHYTEVRWRLSGKRPWSTPELTEIARWQEEPNLEPRRVTSCAIIEAASVWLEISRHEIISMRREKRIVYPRHIIMYLLREMTSCSFPTIGRMLGDRDHTTAIVGARKISARLANGDAKLADDIAMVRFLACGGA